MLGVVMLGVAGFSAGLAISAMKGNLAREVVWGMWAIAVVSLVISVVAFAAA